MTELPTEALASPGNQTATAPVSGPTFSNVPTSLPQTERRLILAAQGSALSLRPISNADLPFLEALYASTRQAEVDRTGWPALQKQAFLRQQFQAQHQYYQAHIPHAHFDLLLNNGQAIGRLYLAWETHALRLVDISLLPESRGQGLGTAIIQAIMQQAAAAGLRIDLHVENENPAYRLYQRLGFKHREDKGIYQLLSWQAEATDH